VSVAVLHADDSLVALDKPAGLLTVPGRKIDEPSLWRLAEAQLGARLFAVPRLDRETSGLVVFARSPEVHRSLNRGFELRQVNKEYRALVFPPPSQDGGRLTARLISARRGFMRIAKPGEAGQEAVTDYRVLGRLQSGEALVELRPLTGRTHQLRLQLADLGSPIVGEPHYRQLGGASPRPAERLWLHSHALELTHPATTHRMRLEAPLPEGLHLRGLNDDR
jgi:tRNA pseudouridine32 synthase / 23S rRNA pseudouridine746 synthase